MVKSRLLASQKKRYKKFARRFLRSSEKLTGVEVKLKKVKTIVNTSLRMVLILITLLREKALVVNVVMAV
nr:MAG TPA: hypothetical protein [Caudoviricetes sp.]